METGFYKIPNNEYHSEKEHVSSSSLRKILRSPAHYFSSINTPNIPTDAMAIGSVFHTAVLEPDLFETSVACCPSSSRATKEGKAEWASFNAQNSDKICLKKDDIETILRMRDSVLSHKEAVKWLTGEIEVSGFWTDNLGMKYKIRPDVLPGAGICVDLKSTKDASVEGFRKEAANYLYHFQAAFYLEGLTEITNIPHEHFVFVAVEKEPPFAVNVFIASHEFIQKGREEVKKAMDILTKCKSENKWPGYSSELVSLDLPGWVK